MEFGANLTTGPQHPTEVVLALGSNLGDSHHLLATARAQLAAHPKVWVETVSPLAKTAPVGGPEQPDFLNQVVVLRTLLAPLELLRFCQTLEQQAQRERQVHWGPRTLDIDVIQYEGVTSNHPDLTLPHPRAHSRGFVLVPWFWAQPDAILDGEPVAVLATAAQDADTVVQVVEQRAEYGEQQSGFQREDPV